MSGYEAIRSGSLGQRLRFLFSDSFLYGGGAAISKLVALFALPVLTRAFSTAEYGVMDAIAVLGSVFVAFMTFGHDSAVARFFYETEDPADRRQIVTQGLITQVVLCALLSAAAWVAAPFLLTHVVAAPEYTTVFRVVVVTFPFTLVLHYTRGLLKWTFRRAGFLALSVGSTAAVLLLTVLFAVLLRMGVIGVFYAQLAGAAGFAVLGLVLCRDLLAVPRGFQFGRQMIRFGWPYIVTAVASLLVPALDRSLITNVLGLDALGVYAVGYRFAFALTLPIFAFQTAWGPFCYALYKEPNAAETYQIVLVFFAVLLGGLSLAMVVFGAPLIGWIASARYQAGAVVVLPLVVGLTIEALSWITGIGIDLSKQSHHSAISYVLGLAATALGIFLLIHPLGIVGVAWAMAIGRLVQGAWYTWAGHRVYPLRFHFGATLKALATLVVLGLGWEALPPLTVAGSIGAAAFLLLGYAGIVWGWVFTDVERARVQLGRRRLQSSLLPRR